MTSSKTKVIAHTLTNIIPLFPLEVVLFPGSALPLHIFEERYKTLIQECEDRHTVFGINCLSEGALSPAGCTARVESILQRYPDGRSDIVVRGERRYRLERDEEGSAPYRMGAIHELTDRAVAVDEPMAREAVRLYNHVISVAYRGALPSLEYHDDGQLSFRIAQKSGMSLRQRQQLLELDAEQDRLSMLHAYLSSVLPKLERLEEVKRVIQNDGYL
jgi:ATP-dependent Lon protease